MESITGWICVEQEFHEVEIALKDGKLDEITETGNVSEEEPEQVLIPGFIDIHNHGAVGVDVNSAKAEDLLKVSAFLATQGVTSWLPTLVPDTDSAYQNAIFSIEDAMDMQSETIDFPGTARILGVHYEGIFANEHMCGALHKEHFRTYGSAQDLDSLPIPERGVKMMTFAPEVRGGIELAERLAEKGWFASIGHTSASPDVLDNALDAGATHLTHFFNAMTGLHHRDLGVVGWALTEDVTFDIIADGVHVNPRMLDLAVQMKGVENVALISDSIAPTAQGDGEFEVWGEQISVKRSRTSNSNGSIAGSVCTLADSFRLLRQMGYEYSEIQAMSSFVPTELLGLVDRGYMSEGSLADFLVVEDETVVKTFVGGVEVKPSESS